MNTLFPIEPVYPPGFQYHPDFLTNEEEQGLLAIVREIELHTFRFQGYEAKRKVASFGFDYSFDTGTLKKGQPIPSEFTWLVERVALRLGRKTDEFAELLVTEYPAGAVINWHRDAPPFDVIAGVSLSADCIFKMRPYEKKDAKGGIINLPVQRRSLYIMEGLSRSSWQHATAPVRDTRYSITLRTLR